MEHMTTQKIMIGIPAYNEETRIAPVIIKALQYTDNVFVCDDGSTDLTSEIAQRMGVNVQTHDKNKGYGAAIKTIFEHAQRTNADVLITIDGDNQHEITDIPKLVEKINQKNVDIVIASRFLSKKSQEEIPLNRKMGINLINSVMNSTSLKELSDTQSGFRAYSYNAINSITISDTGMGASLEILYKADENNLTISEIPTYINYNTSKPYNFLKHGFDLVSNILSNMPVSSPPNLHNQSLLSKSLILTLYVIVKTSVFLDNLISN